MDTDVIFEIVKCILTVFGLLAIPLIKGLWNVVKEGKDVVDKRKLYSNDGKWTEQWQGFITYNGGRPYQVKMHTMI